MAKDFDKLTPSEKNEVITGTKSVKRAPYDPANPHTRFNADNEVTNTLYLKTMQDPKTRDAYRKELEDYDKSKASKPKKEATVPVGQSEDDMSIGKKCGGKVKKMARGGGIEIRGKTKGRMV